MGREWQPGDVAVIEGPWMDDRVRVALVRKRKVAMDESLEFAYVTGGYDMVNDLAPSFTARPLVVIDPEDAEAAKQLAFLYDSKAVGKCAGEDMQDALRSLVTPPKPDEPQGLGAVVEDEDGERYVRHGLADDTDGQVTWCNSIGVGRSWARINGARILSEGVQP